MAKVFSLLGTILCLAAFLSFQVPTSSAGDPAVAADVKDNVWVSRSSRVSCTMCLSCDNPCHPLPPPTVPVLTPPSYPDNVPPPPDGSYYYAPPPPQGYPFPPPYFHYPGPPPPNPILPYYPFFFHTPPPPSDTYNGSSPLLACLGSSLQIFLLFLPFLVFF